MITRGSISAQRAKRRSRPPLLIVRPLQIGAAGGGVVCCLLKPLDLPQLNSLVACRPYAGSTLTKINTEGAS